MDDDGRPRRSRPSPIVLLAGGLLGLGAVVLLSGCIGDCGSWREVRSSTGRQPASVVLDRANPIAEQRIEVHVNAAALPTTGTTDARLVIFGAEDAPPLPSSSAAASSSAARSSLPAAPTTATPSSSATALPPTPPAYVPEVTIIRDDTGEVVATAFAAGSSGMYSTTLASLPLDCPMGEACDRTYRIRVAAPGLAEGEEASLSWLAQVDIRYTGIESTCGMPDGASATVTADDPILIPAADTAFAPLVAGEETAGPLSARHVTIASDGPDPVAASLRLTIPRTRGGEPSTVPAQTWVRVFPDGSSTPTTSMDVAAATDNGDGTHADATLDVPILGDCAAGEPCRRGYWLVFQDYAAAPWPAGLFGRPIPAVGPIAWNVAATATYEGGGASAGRLSVTLDDGPDGLTTTPIEAVADEVVLTRNKVPSAIDAVLTYPERPGPTNGLDPLGASVVVVHVKGFGIGLVTSVDGDGAESRTGYFNGDGATSLVAHPFDRCPPAGPCTVTLRLVATFNVEKYGAQSSSANLSWSLSVLGAPAGTTVTFGSPYDLPAR